MQRTVPLLLILVAAMSVLFLGLATVAIASPLAPPLVPQAPMILPATTASTASGSGSGSSHWILGAPPVDSTAKIANRMGAQPVGGESTGIYRVPAAKATRFARKLQSTVGLSYAEPDVKAIPAGYPSDLFWNEESWLNRIVNTTDVTPPPAAAGSPTLGLIEQAIDPNHPDLQQANLTHVKSVSAAADSHGTAIAAIAGSPGEGLGIRGVWPGMAMRQFPSGLSCSSTTAAVIKAAKAKVSVINMSYGFAGDTCYSHYLATELAVQKGVVPVASAGNTYLEGNAPMRPATDPHVISVSAVDPGNDVAPFATRNDKVDLTAPGVDVYAPTVSTSGGTAAGTKTDYGWAPLSGTSYSAPMVAAAATWLRQARPYLDGSQVSRLLGETALDLGAAGKDDDYGNGLLNIGSSLVVDTPPGDALEPNDDISWINGSILPKKAKFVWKGGLAKKKSVTATLNRDKDPADVYQVKIPPKAQILITAAQFEGDVRLDVLKPSAKTIVNPGKKLIVRSDRPAPKTEGVRVKNLKKKAQTIYVSVTTSPRYSYQYDFYRLSVRPSK